jgi:hypothetical protein
VVEECAVCRMTAPNAGRGWRELKLYLWDPMQETQGGIVEPDMTMVSINY